MIDLFFSYSHLDEDLRDELEIHLTMLQREGMIRVWHDRRIPPGGSIGEEINEHLEEADVILLLVSPYFLASDYCYEIEMRRALERHDAGEALVIPVILQPCDWKHAPFGNLRATPKDGKPVTKFPNMHDAFLDITTDIRWAAEELGKADLGAETGRGSTKPTDDASRNPSVRSSNLRVQKEFSDHEKDIFADETFEYVASFFENSLNELAGRIEAIEVRFRRVSDTEFTAAVYSNGDKKSSCRIWQPGRKGFGGDIAYSMDETSMGSSMNDSMRVEDDGYKLGMKPLGMTIMGSRQEELLSKQGVAEYFWRILISPLQ